MNTYEIWSSNHILDLRTRKSALFHDETVYRTQGKSDQEMFISMIITGT